MGILLPELSRRRGVSISVARRDKKRDVEKEEAWVLVAIRAGTRFGPA